MIVIRIDTDNDAFADDALATGIGVTLRLIANKVERGVLPPFTAADLNGNTVATVEEEVTWSDGTTSGSWVKCYPHCEEDCCGPRSVR